MLRIFTWMVFITVAVLLAVVVTAPIWKENIHIYQAGALGELEALYAMEENYQHDHGEYALTWQDLGAPLGAGIRPDGRLGWSEYTFTLVPVVGSSRDHAGYLIIGRPMEWGWLRWRSFLLNDRGQIRATTRDREPTEHDPIFTIVPR